MNTPARPPFRTEGPVPLRLIALSLAAAASAHAGLVTWGLPTTIAGGSDVSTSGTLVVAHNLGGAGIPSAAVNGVTFTPFVTNGPSNTVGNVTLSSAANILGASTFGEVVPPFSTLLPATYRTLLESASFTGGSPAPTITLALAGLSVGTQYQFQWWANQSSFFNFDPNASAPAFPTTTATAGNSVSLARTGAVSGTLGQYAIGVFTADATTQSIAFTGSNPQTVLNAFQLRALAAPVVPEPGSCLFGIAVAGAICARRRPISRP